MDVGKIARGGTGRSRGGADEWSESLASKMRKAHQALGRPRPGGLRGTAPAGFKGDAPGRVLTVRGGATPPPRIFFENKEIRHLRSIRTHLINAK